jgi:hypothetical protein
MGATVVFPLLVPYHPEYVFPLAFSGVVVAGCVVGTIYGELRKNRALIANAWVLLACLLNMPSLASHYLDGSRTDLRSAAQYVQTHWHEGDRVTGFGTALFHYYAPQCVPTVPLRGTPVTAALDAMAKESHRLWIVVPSCRSGLPQAIAQWVGANCSHELRVCRTRYDYAEYAVDVFLFCSKVGP